MDVAHLEVSEFEIEDLKLIVPSRSEDERGFLSEVCKKRALAQAGIYDEFVQDNHSRSNASGSPLFSQTLVIPAAGSVRYQSLSTDRNC